MRHAFSKHLLKMFYGGKEKYMNRNAEITRVITVSGLRLNAGWNSNREYDSTAKCPGSKTLMI